MNRQSVAKTQKPKNSTLFPPIDILQRKTINRTDFGVSTVDTRSPSEHQAVKPSLPGAESNFSCDFSKIPVRLNSSCPIQAKLKIGQPNDKYEQEADRVAELVMRMPEPPLSSSVGDSSLANSTNPRGGTIRRVCPTCSEEYKTTEVLNRPVVPTNLCPNCRTQEEGVIQTKQITSLLQRSESGKVVKEDDEEKNNLQAKAQAGATPAVSSEVASGIQSLKGRGLLLSEQSRSFFEPRFGIDLSQVKIHYNTVAARLAHSVNARAFTVGRDVVFGAGQYQPHSSDGKRLLAHELTHVVQQNRTQNSIKGSVATTIHRMSGESIYRACHYPSFAGQGGVKDGANWWYPHDFVGPLQVGDKRAVPVNIGYKVPKSPDASYNCMGWALSHAGTKKSWLQGVNRNASHPWPEEELLVSKGCKKAKSSQTADHKVRLYEYKNQDQFHIVRQECDGLWSGKTGDAHLWRGITSPENHTTSFYSQPLKNLRISDWACT